MKHAHKKDITAPVLYIGFFVIAVLGVIFL